MVKKWDTPCPMPKRGLPCEFKYDWAIRGYANILRAFLYAIREEYGADAAVRIKERIDNMSDRVKEGFVKPILEIFKIDGDDAETIGAVFDVWGEVCGQEGVILERSETVNRIKYTKCPWKTEPKDLSGWCNSFNIIVGKTVTPKVAFEPIKLMCAGDPHCEFVWKIEE